MYEKTKIKIKSILPDDNFNILGEKGYIYKDLTEIDKRLLIRLDKKEVRTSLVKSITETANEIEVKTMNSVYILEKI